MNYKSVKKRVKNFFTRKIRFSDLIGRPHIFLYAGDIPQNGLYTHYTGLSILQEDDKHIRHDITTTLPLPDNCVDVYQSEDVFEHIKYEDLDFVIAEIYRVLKPGGYFRLSIPDYGCDILINRTQKDENGNFLFDPGGGGEFVDGKVIKGGHMWYPKYDSVKKLLEKSPFEEIKFYHYYDETGNGVTHPIDYSKGHVMRTPDHDSRVKDPYRPLSLVVDCIKKR